MTVLPQNIIKIGFGAKSKVHPLKGQNCDFTTPVNHTPNVQILYFSNEGRDLGQISSLLFEILKLIILRILYRGGEMVKMALFRFLAKLTSREIWWCFKVKFRFSKIKSTVHLSKMYFLNFLWSYSNSGAKISPDSGYQEICWKSTKITSRAPNLVGSYSSKILKNAWKLTFSNFSKESVSRPNIADKPDLGTCYS